MHGLWDGPIFVLTSSKTADKAKHSMNILKDIRPTVSVHYCILTVGLSLLLLPFLNGSLRAQGSDQLDVVVLDAGHGGKDAGNLGTRRYRQTEKDVALSVTLKLGAYINEHFPEVKVIYTRDDDTFVPLHKRTEIANKNKADLFISVHCNAASNTAATGTETYVMGFKYEKTNLELTKRENSVIFLEDDYEENYNGMDPNNPESNIIAAVIQNAYQAHSISFAHLVEKQFSERVQRRSRGVKQSILFVMNRTTMPSVLVELGFLTNPREEDFLLSEKGQDYMASAIFRAFREYKSRIESVDKSLKTTPAPVVSESTREKFEEANPYGIHFKIQLLSSTHKVDQNEGSFKDLKEVEERSIDGRYKYFTGTFDRYSEAKKALEEIRGKGHQSAFVVAFKGDEPISVKKAIKETKEDSF